MVKGYQRILLLVSALLVSSCAEEFTPKAAFEERLILYCVVSANNRGTVSPAVILARTYDVDGLDPSVNTNDPAVRGAVVEFAVRNIVTPLAERSTSRIDTSRYTGPQRYYGAGSIAVRAGDTVSVSARLPDGRSVSAWTIVPRHKAIENFPLFPRGFTTAFNPLHFGSSFVITWEGQESEQHLYFPRLLVNYRMESDTVVVDRSFEVPVRYVDKNGTRLPVYPNYITSSAIAYEFAVIDEAFARLSAGDPDKSRYRIVGVSFALKEFDFPLSRYYASVNGYLDQYSVRLDETIYSNISGGIGVFGSCYEFVTDFGIDNSYALRFGYRL